MNTTLKNSILTVTTDTDGAELKSIKKDNIEYLWQADSQYWGRSAPILFPIVGRLKEDEYFIDEKRFELNQHGFARDMEFNLVKEEADRVKYQLTANEAILKKYPYQFKLNVEYRLEGNQILVSYQVINDNSQQMYFSIGGHPAFNCPLLEGEEMSDYYLEFDQKEELYRYFIDNSLISNDKELVLEDKKIIELSHELFAQDALVFKDFNSDQLALKSKKSNKAVTVRFTDFPYLGIWSQTGKAPFICIEPWYGIADLVNHNKDFKDKEGILKLEAEEEFNCQYKIIIE